MPHRCGENYLKDLIENAYYSTYRGMIQSSSIRFRTVNLGPLDRDKKVLVLGLNGTLCDISEENEVFTPDLARPHLEIFLTRVFQYYNILIWSSCSLSELFRKCDLLKIRDSDNYTITAYIDHTLMQTVVSNHLEGPTHVKNLNAIFWQNSFFTADNMVMVDHLHWHVLQNPDRAILISKYEKERNLEDDELLNLLQYLEALVTDDTIDFRSRVFKNW